MLAVLTVRMIGSNVSSRLAVMIWRRGKAKMNRLLGSTPRNTGFAHGSTCRLPYEIIAMIIAHLTHDHQTLKSFSLTCRSWYTAAVPHVHHTLILREMINGMPPLEPLPKLHELGLIPLVKDIWVRRADNWFTPRAFSPSDLRYFSAFTNVQSLSIYKFNIHHFIPGFEHYFQQFSPTLRSITLFHPFCNNPQQLSYFLTLFPNLDDIDIQLSFPPYAPAPNTELIPFSAPKFGGRLNLCDFWPTETWTYLIAACGGLRFRHIALRKAGNCAPILLGACSKTLETLRLYLPDDPG